MSGLTWARNENDDRAISLKELSETFLRFKAKHGLSLKAVKLNRLTLLALPLRMREELNPISTFYGVPIEIDDALELWEFTPVYAGVTCWLCGGSSTQTCQCHNHAQGKKAAPCNMVCNA